MDLLLPTQTWIGRHTELVPSWAQAWRAHSSKPWGIAWVHFIQALAEADAGRVGFAVRATASGLGLDEARIIETDWNAVHGVQWRENSPPTWDADRALSEILVPTPPVPWRELRMRWQARHPRHRHTSAWAILQWALQVVPIDERAARPCSMKDLRAVLDLSLNTLSRARGDLAIAGLMSDHRLKGRSNTMMWPTPFADGAVGLPSVAPGHVSVADALPETLSEAIHAPGSPRSVAVSSERDAGILTSSGQITDRDRFLMESLRERDRLLLESAAALASSGMCLRLSMGLESSSLEFNPPATQASTSTPVRSAST